MGDLQATTLTGRETTLPAAAVAAFKKSLRGQLIAPGDASYEEARQVWNANIDRRPGLICRPAGVADVITAVQFARTHTIGNPTSSKSSVMRPSTSWSPTARPGRRRSAAWLWANWGAR